ncbi:hypothetical protein K9M59_01315 [Candidatus Gracilibacteria bacterium]|nr:hypothetical protein [Candidatus Gracilibacteria bacterium]MCF7819207.1 hypothetical protein [Candidatus Gracilibacteria bacterium]
MELIIASVVFLVFGAAIGWFFWGREKTQYKDILQENIQLKSDIEERNKKLLELPSLKEQSVAQKQIIEEKQRRILQLEAKEEQLQERLKETGNKLNKLEEQQERKEKEFQALVEKLSKAEEKLQEEQSRIRREDEKKLAQEQEERDRIWNDHENLVLAKLREVCQKQDVGFQFYENTSLPPGFDGKIKPDFLIKFLDQYVVFDAKKSKDPKTYIRTQVKETAKKVKGQSDVYKVVFFVMPLNEIQELKELYFFEDGISFHVISIEAIEPILRNFKKISEYEKIQDFDPQDREDIVNLIASYDRHISLQNAANIVLTRDSLRLINHDENLSDEFAEEVFIKKESMGVGKLNQTDIKRYSQSLEKQKKEIDKMTSSKPSIESNDVRNAQDSLSF